MSTPQSHPPRHSFVLARAERWVYPGLGVTILASAVPSALIGNWIAVFNAVTFGCCWLFFANLRRSWVRGGYRDGHWAAVTAALEARERGMGFHDWVGAELERASDGTLVLPPWPEAG